jgi:hypothetical protein
MLCQARAPGTRAGRGRQLPQPTILNLLLEVGLLSDSGVTEGG